MLKRLIVCALAATFLAAIDRVWAVDNPLRDSPPEYVAALREAVRAFNARDFATTLKAVDTAETISPPNPLTLNTRGAALIEQKKFDEGSEYCRKALALDPKFYPARFNLCEVPLVQKRYAEARAMFQRLLDENPKDELVKYRVLLTWLLEHNDDEARRVLDTIPFPGNTPAYYYGNAAWEFAHGNDAEAKKWVMRGNWVFRPEITTNFSQPFVEVGWLKEQPVPSTTLPELMPSDTSPKTFELATPPPALAPGK
ncbi:MAG TPA: tetratricopeptide repeat protein [Chthoniobacteraceae bacterium]|nr:tetratricopeptide repeat protein [Chthoniobacteraceae bacterium]